VERRHRGMILLALALAAVGLVWIGQGLGILRGSSFMTDDVRWAMAGAGLVVLGAVVGWLAFRARPRA
jgi:ABC-type nickel/cobalt efflux system permease component RcnA